MNCWLVNRLPCSGWFCQGLLFVEGSVAVWLKRGVATNSMAASVWVVASLEGRANFAAQRVRVVNPLRAVLRDLIVGGGTAKLV